MNRFRFKLQSVLRYRGIIEENKKRELGEAIYKLQLEEEKERKIEDKITKHFDSSDKTSTGKTSVEKLKAGSNYSEALYREKGYQLGQIEKASEVVESRRGVYIEARKQKMVVEKLKEKKKEEYDFELNKEEQKLIDEMNNLKNK